MNKEMTGRLIAEARREKHMTQQELADKLHITGKAVSKWETGVSAPDVGLLIPLSEALGLSVTELLEGKRTVTPEDRSPEQVEDIVKAVITYSGEIPEKQSAERKKRVLFFAACVLTAVLEFGLLWWFGVPSAMDVSLVDAFYRGAFTRNGGSHYAVIVLLSIGLGAYLMFFAPERLPSYYDDNEIHYFSNGVLRLNMAGLTFNNRNWPHILRCLRIWSMLAAVLTIPVYAAVAAFFPLFYEQYSGFFLLFLYLGGLFAPIYIVGRKYK